MTKPTHWTERKWPNAVTLKTDNRMLYAERTNEMIVSARVMKP